MKTNIISYAVSSTFVLSIALSFAACSGSRGGINAEDSAKSVNASFDLQKKITEGLEKIRQEVTQVPTREQISAAPIRDALGFFILERIQNEPYKFVSPPQPNSSTGEYSPSNTLRVALVTYTKVDDGPYRLVEKNVTIPGYRLDADVVLIDHSIPAVVLRKTFRGAKPETMSPNSNYSTIKAGDTEVVGKKPIDEIQKFLNALPYKK